MSDESTNESSDDTTQESAPQEGEQQEKQTFDAEYVEKLRKEAAKYRTEAKANANAAKRLSEIEESQKSEADKASEQLKQEVKRADDAEAALLRYEVAAEKEIPPKALRLLQGSTREEIESSADYVLELIGDAGKPRAPKPDPNQGKSGKGPDSTAEQFAGAVGSMFTN